MPFTADMPGRPPVVVPSVFYPATDCVVVTQQQTVEQDLSELPDRVADAQRAWKTKEQEVKHEAARLFLSFKAKGLERTGMELKAMVQSDPGYYQLCLDAVVAESEFTRLNEKLLASKKLASMRAAF